MSDLASFEGDAERCQPSAPARKCVRTRNGCWNCKRRRKKCDEKRPTCTNCRHKAEVCEWGVKLSFRSENVQSLPSDHPSMRQDTCRIAGNGRIKIFDVTREVIRDYWNEAQMFETGHFPSSPGASSLLVTEATLLSPDPDDVPNSIDAAGDVDIGEEFAPPFALPIVDFERPPSVVSSHSNEIAHSAATNLLDLGREAHVHEPPTHEGSSQFQPNARPLAPVSAAIDDIAFVSGTPPQPSSSSSPCDGIFLPGSAYLEWHSTLRNHMFDITRSVDAGFQNLPEAHGNNECVAEERGTLAADSDSSSPALLDVPNSLVPTPRAADLEPQEEYELWKNWTDEIAPWLDKFDNDCHFQRILPLLAKHHSHLRYSILALSARQRERKAQARDSSRSLSLYQEAIHLLIPHLSTGNTAVVASCVVLCVLEMMSCSPRMWRRHLEGCARLIQSLGITGFSGKLEQALFWCFARMDVCGGLISSERTLIPLCNWTTENNLRLQVQLFRSAPHFDMYANYAVFLCANVLDILSCTSPVEYSQRWLELFQNVSDWHAYRPPELESMLELNASTTDYSRPFPTILFSNAPAISGNQIYHTAALLLLQNRPREATLPQNCRSILWHARRICAISISNHHHGCWTNCIQPLWIAGRLMSHPSEHRAILETYARIERTIGWEANWRAKDLIEFWGELNDH